METLQLKPVELSLNFFKDKDKLNFTPESLNNYFFKDQDHLTSHEKVYLLCNALKDLEIVAPIEIECPHCSKHVPVPFEFTKVMELDYEFTDKSYNRFTINLDDKILSFKRPQNMQYAESLLNKYKSEIANFASYAETWLYETNIDNFSLNDLSIKELVLLLAEFRKHLLIPTFNIKTKCPYCDKEIETNVSVTLEDLCSVLQNL